MPKSKLKSTPNGTPESPRKTPKKEPTPKKRDSSESPVRIPKPKFNLDESNETTTDPVSKNEIKSKKDKKDEKPIFENKIKLKKERKIKNEKDDRNIESLNDETKENKNPQKTKAKSKSKSKEGKKEKVETKKEVKIEAPATPDILDQIRAETARKHESPHKIVFKKEKKTKALNTKTDQARKSKKKSSKKKIEKDDDKEFNGGAKITDFFEIRRSSRKPAKQIELERTEQWKQFIKQERTDGLEIRDVPLKGRGVFSSRPFQKNEFVVEYAGDLITPKQAEIRDQKYSANTDKYGSYMYYFIHKGTKWCIDATIESGKLGRLLNHSCKTPNCATKILDINGMPKLIIYAKTDIEADVELIYDYGDRGKLSLEAHPWLAL